MKTSLDTKTETQIVAMVARGDTYDTIQRVLSGQGISIAISTISAVKKRNTDALEYMKGVLVEHESHQSTKLLDKSRRLIERKLDNALTFEDKMRELHEAFTEGSIDEAYYKARIRLLEKSDLSVGELNAVGKEMFNQSQVEQGKPTSISDNPTQAKENLRELLEAINNKDESAILAAIFPQDA